jgi:hypothetical protein
MAPRISALAPRSLCIPRSAITCPGSQWLLDDLNPVRLLRPYIESSEYVYYYKGSTKPSTGMLFNLYLTIAHQVSLNSLSFSFLLYTFQIRSYNTRLSAEWRCLFFPLQEIPSRPSAERYQTAVVQRSRA